MLRVSRRAGAIAQLQNSHGNIADGYRGCRVARDGTDDRIYVTLSSPDVVSRFPPAVSVISRREEKNSTARREAKKGEKFGRAAHEQSKDHSQHRRGRVSFDTSCRLSVRCFSIENSSPAVTSSRADLTFSADAPTMCPRGRTS